VSGNCTTGFEIFAYVGIDVTSIIDNIGSTGDCYRVGAFNNDGVSSYSNTAQVAPPDPKRCKGKKC
jgi:hypothetical protein